MSTEVFTLRKMCAIRNMFLFGQMCMKIYTGLSFNEKAPDAEIV